MIRGMGLDLCEVERMRDTDHRNRLMRRCFTDAERSHVLYRRAMGPETAAGIFAAKEAALKALGTGMTGISLSEVEVRHNDLGMPYLLLWGAAKIRAEALGARQAYLSITHTKETAAAVAILEG
jgi:holo-[acyl-carrier protein] synthase